MVAPFIIAPPALAPNVAGASPAVAAPLFPRAPDPIRFWSRLAPGRAAIVDRARGGGRRVTYAELDAAADRWAGALRRLGVGPGERVAVLSGNRRELVELFYACGRVGAALVPLNWRLAAAELGPVLAHARVALLVGEERFRTTAERAVAGLPHAPRWVELDHDAPGLLAGSEGDALGADRAADPEEPALILYTSGTTGQPKGVILPQRQIFYNALATSIAWELGASDVAPITTPCFHVGGWGVFGTPIWMRGGTAVLFDRFEPDEFLGALAEDRCTIAFGVPTQFRMLTESARWGAALPSLRHFISGGAPCPSALIERVRASGYRFREGYGLTECGPNCFATSDDAALAKPGSVGWPVPFLEMRLAADADGRELVTAPGEPGELQLRGPQMFGGYLFDPERTAEALTSDGWLRTGDLARRDADGAYAICGRRKEMFISGGENVFPGEVESALCNHPALSEVVVVGVPDAKWGEVGCAFVVRRPGAAPVTPEEVIAFARTRLAGYKVPKSVVFMDDFPRLGSGKADRKSLAALAPGR